MGLSPQRPGTTSSTSPLAVPLSPAHCRILGGPFSASSGSLRSLCRPGSRAEPRPRGLHPDLASSPTAPLLSSVGSPAVHSLCRGEAPTGHAARGAGGRNGDPRAPVVGEFESPLKRGPREDYWGRRERKRPEGLGGEGSRPTQPHSIGWFGKEEFERKEVGDGVGIERRSDKERRARFQPNS